MTTIPAAFILSIFWLHRPIGYHFDARTANTPSAFGWTEIGDRIDPPGSEFITGLGRRKRSVTVAMPGGLQDYVSDEVGSIVLYSKGGQIDYCLVQSVPMTIESAIAEAKTWSDRWGGIFSQEDVDKFHSENKLSPVHHVWSPVRLDPKRTPKHQVGLAIWPIFSGEKRCYISMSIYWKHGEEPK